MDFFWPAATISSRQFCDRGNYFVDKTYSDNPKELESRARTAKQVLSKRLKVLQCFHNSLEDLKNRCLALVIKYYNTTMRTSTSSVLKEISAC